MDYETRADTTIQALPLPGSQVSYDSEAVASWSYNSKTRTMVSYDTPQAASQKAEYIKNNGLGGAMWWETSGDQPSNNSTGQSLIELVVQGLGGYEGKNLVQRQNILDYPNSKYDNLRSGMPKE